MTTFTTGCSGRPFPPCSLSGVLQDDPFFGQEAADPVGPGVIPRLASLRPFLDEPGDLVVLQLEGLQLEGLEDPVHLGEETQDGVAVGTADPFLLQEQVALPDQIEDGSQGGRRIQVVVQTGLEVAAGVDGRIRQLPVFFPVVRDLPEALDEVVDPAARPTGPGSFPGS